MKYPSEFCPKTCLRLNETDPMQHQGCLHLEDIELPVPYSAFLQGAKPKIITVVGMNGGDVYYEEVMSSGQISRGVVSKSRIKK